MWPRAKTALTQNKVKMIKYFVIFLTFFSVCHFFAPFFCKEIVKRIRVAEFMRSPVVQSVKKCIFSQTGFQRFPSHSKNCGGS